MKLLMLATFVGFTLLVALISYLKTKGDDTSSKEGYFLAGRGLPGIVICGSLMMTNISAEQLVGQNGQSYVGSMSVMGWELSAAISLVIFALVLLPRFLKRNITTIPEFLEGRYGSSIRRLVAIIFLAAYIITMLPLILYAGSVVLEQLFGVSEMFGISRFAAIALCCISIGIIGSIYAIFGGLRAVAVSDTINGVGLMIGCAVIVPLLAFTALGDGSFVEGVRTFAHAGEKLNAIDPVNALAPEIPWPLLLTGIIINSLSYWATNQSIIQRTFGAKNCAEAQKGALWTGFLKCFSPLFTVVLGIIAFLMFGAGMESQDLAYPRLLLTILPKPLLGFFAAVMFGAILSSFNSVLNSASTIFALDLYATVKPEASDEQLVSAGKKFGTVIAVISIAISPFIMYFGQGVQAFLNECWGYYGTPLLVMVLFALGKLPIPAKACWTMSAVHVVLYGIGLNLLSPHICHYLYVTTAVFIVDCLIMFAFAKLAPSKQLVEAPNDPQVDMTPWKHSKTFGACVIIAMVLLYMVFSPLVLGK